MIEADLTSKKHAYSFLRWLGMVLPERDGARVLACTLILHYATVGNRRR